MSDFPHTNRQRRWWFAQLGDEASPHHRVSALAQDESIQKLLDITNHYKGDYIGEKGHMEIIAKRFNGTLVPVKRSGFTFWAVEVNGVRLGPEADKRRGSLRRF